MYLAAPYFPAPPSDETKGPGESVDIECRSEGVPAPTVDWLVNGQPWADFGCKSSYRAFHFSVEPRELSLF